MKRFVCLLCVLIVVLSMSARSQVCVVMADTLKTDTVKADTAKVETVQKGKANNI